jgi:hypothetical protein
MSVYGKGLSIPSERFVCFYRFVVLLIETVCVCSGQFLATVVVISLKKTYRVSSFNCSLKYISAKSNVSVEINHLYLLFTVTGAMENSVNVTYETPDQAQQ